MKRLLVYVSLLAAGLFATSCIDDFLTQYPYSTTSPETFYKTEADFKQGADRMLQRDQLFQNQW